MSIKHPIAQWVNNLNINGFTNWYIPSKDELNHLYKNTSDLFETRSGGWHWSSTAKLGSSMIWVQSFVSGRQAEAIRTEGHLVYARVIKRMPFNHNLNLNLGDEVDGGFYAGKYTLDGVDYALIVAPKDKGEIVIQWKTDENQTRMTYSESDGLANIQAMLMADKEDEITCIPNSTNFTLTYEQEIRARNIYNETGGGHDGMLAALEDFKKSLVESISVL